MERDCSEEYAKMDMECESQKYFRRGNPCKRQTGLLVLLGAVCMIIFMIMTFVTFSHQQGKFSVVESWMKSHTSDLTSVKSDFQTTGNDVEKKVADLEMLVSSLISHVNTSGSSAQEKKLSTIETLMTNLNSSLSSLVSKQEESQKKLEHHQDTSNTELKSLMDSLSDSLSEVRSKMIEDSLKSFIVSRQSNPFSQRILVDVASSVKDMQSSVGEIRSSVKSLSYKLSLANLLLPGCSKPDWIPFSNSCYLFSQDRMAWTQAKDYCAEQGALLLKVENDTETEWEFVRTFVSPKTGYWVGLTDQDTGQWRWVDDTPYTMNKEHWDDGQPDDWDGHPLLGGEDCAELSKLGKLNDNHCAALLRFICKGPKDG